MDGTLNRNIKNFREFKGMSQEELAKIVGKTKNVISNWERGDNSPDVDRIEMLCRALDVTPNQLFGWEPHEAYEKYREKMKMKRDKLLKLEAEKQDLQKKIDALRYEIRTEEDKLRDD